MLVLKLLCVQAFAVVVTAAVTGPSWRSLFMQYLWWEGYLYESDGNYDKCSLVVHSIDYVGFTYGHISVDMKASSSDNITVTFTTTSVWNSSTHLDGSSNYLEFVGHFLRDQPSLYYDYVANVSIDSKYFGTVHLAPSVTRGRSKSNTTLRYGLAIGIPVVLSIILMVSAVMILRWGIKKGYLRHVPMAYKHFINPRKGKTDFEMKDPEAPNKYEQPESHI